VGRERAIVARGVPQVKGCKVKVPINQVACIDLDAPTLPAERIKVHSVVRWRVWCRHCAAWHYHGPGEGHREAHCTDPASPYWRSGYNLAQRMIEPDSHQHADRLFG
jgi:hypothetical protein